MRSKRTLKRAAFATLLTFVAVLISIFIFSGKVSPNGGETSTSKTSKKINFGSFGEGYDLSFDEKEILARLICAEASSEPYYAQVSCAAVIFNRLKDGSFGSTVEEVVKSGSFKSISDGSYYGSFSEKKLDTARDAAEAASKGIDPTGGALYFASLEDKDSLDVIYECGKMIYGK